MTDDRSDRILAEKLKLLYRGSFAVPANVLVALAVAYFLRGGFPDGFLVAWLVATVMVSGVRLMLDRGFRHSVRPCHVCWQARFTAGAVASGLLWGVLCLGLVLWGRREDYVLVTLVAAGLSAGALTSIASCFPAYIGYAGSFVLPLALASIVQHRYPAVVVNGWLVLLFLVVIAIAARNLGRLVDRTIALQVDNQILQSSLKTARHERDHARHDKWSTLGRLSYELRTSLNAILGFSEIIREQLFGPLGDECYREYAAHVHDSGRDLLTLSSELSQLTQSEAGELKLHETMVDLTGVISKCVETVLPEATREGLTLTMILSPRLPFLRADGGKVRQMLLSLLDNAIKFTPPQGRIAVEAGTTEDGGVELVVRDTGIGMKPDDIPRAVEPFSVLSPPFSARNPNMGLGLPICRRLAELHGAEFAISSAPDAGTECRISFPPGRSVAMLAA